MKTKKSKYFYLYNVPVHVIVFINLTIFFQQYKCSSVIDPVTVRSLVPDRLFSQWVYRQQEKAVMSTGNWKWCPSSTCDHILSVVPNSKCQEANGLIQFLSFIFCL